MRIHEAFVCGASLALITGTTLGAAKPSAGNPGNLDAARLQGADREPQNWFMGGRDKDGTYYSPLTTIDENNVKQLGFAWSYDLGKPQRGQEATPLVIDGVMYTSGSANAAMATLRTGLNHSGGCSSSRPMVASCCSQT